MTKLQPGNQNSVRIIAGTCRSRKINFPNAPGLRPTADRIRETLFNWLREDISGEACLDLFAGSGALGFEALSREAGWVTFVDNNVVVKNALLDNLRKLNFGNAEIHCGDAFDWIAHARKMDRKYGIIFLDPPFAANIILQTCSKIAETELLKPGCKIYIETADELADELLPETWQKIKSKKAGAVKYYLFESTRSI